MAKIKIIIYLCNLFGRKLKKDGRNRPKNSRRQPLWLCVVASVVTVLLSVACSETKYVAEDAYLLDKVKVYNTDDASRRDINTSRLKNFVRQKGNSRWFSSFRLPLAAYSLSGRDTTRWLNRTLRAMGEAPVCFDSLLASKTCDDLRTELQNEGYLHADVSLTTRVHGRKMNVDYQLYPGKPYYINKVDYLIADTSVSQLLHLDDSTRWGLRRGQRFSVNELDAERKRITQQLADSGYYRFHKEYITFLADTTACGQQQVDIALQLGLPSAQLAHHPRYHIGSLHYASGDVTDSVIHLRRRVLNECTHIDTADYYSATNLRRTYNHMGRLGAVKYTNITFTERPDTTLLDCDITLQTNKPSMLSFQPEGTNTAGDLGAAASLTYQNRNLFRGSENLSVELRGAYEAIRGLEGYRNQDFVEYSLETRLSFPRFIAPLLSRQVRRNTSATSEVSLLYDLQNRPEFHRRVVSVGWRYKWAPTGSRHQYQLDVLDLNYIFMPWISETFRRQYLDNENNRNAILRYNYEDLFITRIGLGYSYNNGRTALKTNIETSGNLLHLGSNMVGSKKDGRGQYRLFNIAYAQYVKADFNYTVGFKFDYTNQLVLHLGFGIAYPYGNSNVLPFEKRYFSGGANSVRGWSVRSLGPGKYKGNDGNIDFINQTGDLKLDLNVEYRTHLFWKLGGALFVDAGNIWTLREYRDQPGGLFKLRNLADEMALGYGVGLRFNFDYFIVRFDLGMKAVNPAYDDGTDEHFPLLHPRFSRDYAFHFAVGLPF